ncbi:Mo25 family protein [Melia azedarach]|uniref:Mo25 family protein n=1 Tax=Melia azedarach TaxID=155640 RepID=A0ACC1YP50_MELAZ|nr:Mo25 family protein [Melia azedarach]
MKGLFKSKPKSPVEVVRHSRNLLASLHSNVPEFRGTKREEKMAELKEFFKENTLRLLILCLPTLNLEARKDATQVVANLQRQYVDSRLIAPIYLEQNLDLLDTLISGYEDLKIALHYGCMLRECIRHQIIARQVLESGHFRKFFDYVQLPNFDIAADAAETFKELLTRHKATVAAFLSTNFDWFFHDYNSKLLESNNYVTRRQAVKLLSDILLDRSNTAVMVHYVCSKDNLMILMNLLKLFVANENKPPEVMNVLIANQTKLLHFLAAFKLDKENEQFEEDKALVVKEIAELELKVNQ